MFEVTSINVSLTQQEIERYKDTTGDETRIVARMRIENQVTSLKERVFGRKKQKKFDDEDRVTAMSIPISDRLCWKRFNDQGMQAGLFQFAMLPKKNMKKAIVHLELEAFSKNPRKTVQSNSSGGEKKIVSSMSINGDDIEEIKKTEEDALEALIGAGNPISNEKQKTPRSLTNKSLIELLGCATGRNKKEEEEENKNIIYLWGFFRSHSGVTELYGSGEDGSGITKAKGTIEARPAFVRPLLMDHIVPKKELMTLWQIFKNSRADMFDKKMTKQHGVSSDGVGKNKRRASFLSAVGSVGLSDSSGVREPSSSGRLSIFGRPSLMKKHTSESINFPIRQGSSNLSKSFRLERRSMTDITDITGRKKSVQEDPLMDRDEWAPPHNFFAKLWTSDWPEGVSILAVPSLLIPLMESELKTDCVMIFSTIFPRLHGPNFRKVCEFMKARRRVRSSYDNCSMQVSPVTESPSGTKHSSVPFHLSDDEKTPQAMNMPTKRISGSMWSKPVKVEKKRQSTVSFGTFDTNISSITSDPASILTASITFSKIKPADGSLGIKDELNEKQILFNDQINNIENFEKSLDKEATYDSNSDKVLEELSNDSQSSKKEIVFGPVKTGESQLSEKEKLFTSINTDDSQSSKKEKVFGLVKTGESQLSGKTIGSGVSLFDSNDHGILLKKKYGDKSGKSLSFGTHSSKSSKFSKFAESFSSLSGPFFFKRAQTEKWKSEKFADKSSLKSSTFGTHHSEETRTNTSFMATRSEGRSPELDKNGEKSLPLSNSFFFDKRYSIKGDQSTPTFGSNKSDDDKVEELYAARVTFLKRLLLLYAFTGLKSGEPNFFTECEYFPYPLASCVSHGGRVTIRLEDVAAYDMLNFLLFGNPDGSSWRHKYPAPVLKRIAATHDIVLDDATGRLIEKKLKVHNVGDVATNLMDGIKGRHLGIDLPLGGCGNPGRYQKKINDKRRQSNKYNKKKKIEKHIQSIVGFKGDYYFPVQSDDEEEGQNMRSMNLGSSNAIGSSFAKFKDGFSVSTADPIQPVQNVQGGHMYLRVDEFGLHNSRMVLHRQPTRRILDCSKITLQELGNCDVAGILFPGNLMLDCMEDDCYPKESQGLGKVPRINSEQSLIGEEIDYTSTQYVKNCWRISSGEFRQIPEPPSQEALEILFTNFRINFVSGGMAIQELFEAIQNGEQKLILEKDKLILFNKVVGVNICFEKYSLIETYVMETKVLKGKGYNLKGRKSNFTAAMGSRSTCCSFNMNSDDPESTFVRPGFPILSNKLPYGHSRENETPFESAQRILSNQLGIPASTLEVVLAHADSRTDEEATLFFKKEGISRDGLYTTITEEHPGVPFPDFPNLPVQQRTIIITFRLNTLRSLDCLINLGLPIRNSIRTIPDQHLPYNSDLITEERSRTKCYIHFWSWFPTQLIYTQDTIQRMMAGNENMTWLRYAMNRIGNLTTPPSIEVLVSFLQNHNIDIRGFGKHREWDKYKFQPFNTKKMRTNFRTADPKLSTQIFNISVSDFTDSKNLKKVPVPYKTLQQLFKELNEGHVKLKIRNQLPYLFRERLFINIRYKDHVLVEIQTEKRDELENVSRMIELANWAELEIDNEDRETSFKEKWEEYVKHILKKQLFYDEDNPEEKVLWFLTKAVKHNGNYVVEEILSSESGRSDYPQLPEFLRCYIVSYTIQNSVVDLGKRVHLPSNVNGSLTNTFATGIVDVESSMTSVISVATLPGKESGKESRIIRKYLWMSATEAYARRVLGYFQFHRIINQQIQKYNIASVLLGIEGSRPGMESPYGHTHDASGKSGPIAAAGGRKWRYFRMNNALHIPAEFGGIQVTCNKKTFEEFINFVDELDLVNPKSEISVASNNTHQISLRTFLNQRHREKYLFQHILCKKGLEAYNEIRKLYTSLQQTKKPAYPQRYYPLRDVAHKDITPKKDDETESHVSDQDNNEEISCVTLYGPTHPIIIGYTPLLHLPIHNKEELEELLLNSIDADPAEWTISLSTFFKEIQENRLGLYTKEKGQLLVTEMRINCIITYEDRILMVDAPAPVLPATRFDGTALSATETWRIERTGSCAPWGTDENKEQRSFHLPSRSVASHQNPVDALRLLMDDIFPQVSFKSLLDTSFIKVRSDIYRCGLQVHPELYSRVKDMDTLLKTYTFCFEMNIHEEVMLKMYGLPDFQRFEKNNKRYRWMTQDDVLEYLDLETEWQQRNAIFMLKRSTSFDKKTTSISTLDSTKKTSSWRRGSKMNIMSSLQRRPSQLERRPSLLDSKESMGVGVFDGNSLTSSRPLIRKRSGSFGSLSAVPFQSTRPAEKKRNSISFSRRLSFTSYREPGMTIQTDAVELEFLKLHEQIKKGNEAAVTEHCAEENPDLEYQLSNEKGGKTLLMTACEQGRDSIALRLINNSARVDAMNMSNGMTPLHYAVTYNSIDVVSALLENEADIKAKDKNRSTAVHRAVCVCESAQAREILSLLLKREPHEWHNFVDKDMATPYDHSTLHEKEWAQNMLDERFITDMIEQDDL